MKNFNFDGFCTSHLDRDMHSILREKRVVLGLTQQQVADKAKIKLIQYRRFELGMRNIRTASFSLACKVIEALEMDPTKFYHGDYVIGEEIYSDEEGIKYKKSDRLISEDIV